ncbi:hypothetical protein [Streptomyces chumphonensis]|uniref:hypothetical protein n=1 Tax=Streptomyces chumphonensis TaxID=1214925 RepID=UPI003D718586
MSTVYCGVPHPELGQGAACGLPSEVHPSRTHEGWQGTRCLVWPQSAGEAARALVAAVGVDVVGALAGLLAADGRALVAGVSAPMTPERLAEIAAREAAATRGPWGLDPEGVFGSGTVVAEVDGRERIVGELGFGVGEEADADREFVAHARADVPALLAEVGHLRGEVTQWRDQRNSVFETNAWLRERLEESGHARLLAELDAHSRAREVERLRARVDELVQQRDDLLVEDARAEMRREPQLAPVPLVVSRFDAVMEPAPEEPPVLTIGAVAEDGRPVALLLDPEARAKVARWLGADRAAVLRQAADEIAGIDFHPNARVRSLEIAGNLAIRLRRMAAADEDAAEGETGGLVQVADCGHPRTEPCGHDDYHDPHPWADHDHIWCPGRSYEADAAEGETGGAL